MYKRRPKSGGLGIVRTIGSSSIARTQQSLTNKSENVNPSISSQDTKPLSVESSSVKTSSNNFVHDDDDLVLSDSEPSPKRSRIFNSSRSIMKEHTSSNVGSVGLDNTSRSEVNKNSSSNVKSVGQGSDSQFPVKETRPIISKVKKGSLFENLEISQSITSPKISQSATSPKRTSLRPNTNSKMANHSVTPSKYNTSESRHDSSVISNKKQIEAEEKISTDIFDQNQKKKRKVTYLEEFFENAGLILSDGDSPNILRTDQAVFIRDIRKNICNDENNKKRIIERIMKDLEEYCSCDKCFKFAVLSTKTASDCDVSRGATQDSLMRLLLRVDCLQAPVTELLLMDKLAKFVMDDNGGDTPVIQWVRLILQCFRFLEHMDNGKGVNDQLLEIVLVASDITIQQEVILSLPDIIQDTEHHHTALELSKLVRKSNPQLMTSALEALTNLSLQPEIRTQIQPQLLKSLNKMPHEYLPTILKFLFTDGDASSVDEVITYLRNELELGESGGDSASNQVVVFMTLRDALLVSRTLPNIWLKNIASMKTHAQHKPMDIVMLLILLSVTSDQSRHRSIEAVIRSKIRSEMFSEDVINETLKSYIPVIKENFQIAIKLAGSLLKSTEPAIIDFASKIYIGMFVNMEGLWCKWVLTDLQQCVGTGDMGVAKAALSILQHLTNNYHQKVKPLGIILMLLLNKLNDFALNEVCQLMDILCHIAYSEHESSSSDCSILQDEINILVQKQLANSQLSIKRNGIVGSVMTIKHVTIIPENSADSCNTDKDESTDKTKKAIQLLEILLSSSKDNVEAQGLALDQLSHLLISGKILDPAFIQKLSSLMRDKLQDDFLISASDFDSKEDVVKSSLQFYLDDDPEGAIALNLCHLVVDEYETKTTPKVGVSCLHPLLRLLRGLEMSDLSEIDALLGCYINMPVPQVYAEFSQLTAYQQHVALHCLFHCINWFIEVINCFSYLVKNGEPEKVLIRLRTIIWLRGLLARCLPLSMEYTPPLCYFQALPKPKLNSEKTAKKKTKKKGKKKNKKKQESDETVLTGNPNTSQVSEEEEEEVDEGKVADLTKYKHYFRELDIDVWLLLTQPLTLSPTPEKDGQFTPELGPSELLYLLEDYANKISHSLTSSHKRISFLKTANSQGVGFENLDKFAPLHIAKNTIKLLSFLCSFLEKTIEFNQNLIKVNDGILDATGMFMEGSAEIKTCQGKLLRILTILFSWVGFQTESHISYLLAALQKVASRVCGDQAKTRSRPQLVRDCGQYLIQCHEHVLDLTSACSLVDTMKALLNHAEHETNLKLQIASICLEFLEKRWYDMKGNREKGAVLHSRLSELLNNYLAFSQDQLADVNKILTWLSNEHQLLTDKDATLNTFPSFSRLNLHILIGGLLKGLESAVKQKLEDHPTDREQLELWSSFTQGLEILVSVMKAHDSKPNLRVFMKGCTSVLKLFLSQGMSVCTFMFKHEPNTVSLILKKLQVTTRYIQTICNFVKVSKDTGLTQFLPPIRAVMESILLQVRSIIVLNNCSKAFFMGSMKNRDLKGQEIISQETNTDDGEIEPSRTDSESEKQDSEQSGNETDDDVGGDDEGNSLSGRSISI